MGNKEIAESWIAENRLFVDDWTAAALEGFWNDTSVRVPRTVEERRDGLKVWLEHFSLKMRVSFEQEFQSRFGSLSALLPETYIADVFDQNVWPQIRPDIQQYAIHGLAAAWVTGNMGDATTMNRPEQKNNRWHVPIGIRGYGDKLGEIVLTQDGDVLENMTTSRKQLLEAARGVQSHSVATAAR